VYFFDQTVAAGAQPKSVSNFIMGDIMRLLNERGWAAEKLPISAQSMAELLSLIEKGAISNSMGSKVIEIMFDEAKSPTDIVQERGMAQVSDAGAIREMCRQVIAENPKIVDDYKGGKVKAITALVGQVMKMSRGKANPSMVNQLLEELLN